MISEYLMKGIDTLFSNRIATGSANSANAEHNSKPFSKELIKANLHSVVKDVSKSDKIDSQTKENGALTKSRLRTILEKNKDAQIKSVIRRDKSRSVSPYQRISPLGDHSNEQELGDKILFYREQRKTIEKSRVLDKSRVGGSNSRIFRVSSQFKIGDSSSKGAARAENDRPKRTNTRIYWYLCFYLIIFWVYDPINCHIIFYF